METARVTENEWKKVREQVLSFFVLEDGRWVNGRMEQELNRAVDKSIKASESARIKWAKEHANA
jgi:uncharacterized protein YdaU (DUF1376 family)